jgi:hypothetical protein
VTVSSPLLLFPFTFLSCIKLDVYTAVGSRNQGDGARLVSNIIHRIKTEKDMNIDNRDTAVVFIDP